MSRTKGEKRGGVDCRAAWVKEFPYQTVMMEAWTPSPAAARTAYSCGEIINFPGGAPTPRTPWACASAQHGLRADASYMFAADVEPVAK